ncbi:MAG: XrtA/PEP-CTERM system histidine kinase PrsK [Thermodesulfobacteriota bacterium]
MKPELALCVGGGIVSLLVALWALWRWERSWVLWSFLLGMGIFSAEAFTTALTLGSQRPSEVLQVQRWAVALCGASAPVWLVFSLGFGRVTGRGFLARWKAVLAGVLVVPAGMGVLLGGSLFKGNAVRDEALGWFLPLGWEGDLFFACLIVAYVLVLANLERTLRASVGHARWRLKFTVFGLGGLGALKIYTGSQALLFHGLSTHHGLVGSIALILAGLFLAVGIQRMGKRGARIELSQTALYRSLTLFIVGAYLLVTSVLAQILSLLGALEGMHYKVLFTFVAMCGLAVLVFSDRFRYGLRRFLRRHFTKAGYDYRELWMRFSQRTGVLLDRKGLCREAVNLLSETFQALSVHMWLLDPSGEKLLLAASTVFPEGHDSELPLGQRSAGELLRLVAEHPLPAVDLDDPDSGWAWAWKECFADFFKEAMIRYLAPLSAGGERLGVVSLGERVRWVPMSEEDLELLRTLSDHIASNLNQLRLLDQLRQAREMEAFQAMSAFLVHDLKNLSAKLALTAENLPEYFHEPQFREDAVRVISQSAEKIKIMCNQLSFLRQGLQLKPQEVDLNSLVRESLRELDGVLKTEVKTRLEPTPRVKVDPELMKKAMVNLLLNANEAVEEGGLIRVITETVEGGVLLGIQDNGKGMSKEFMESSLFRPFRSTKPKGMGVGLFQIKTILDAHGASVRVESQEGKGTTFWVRIPQ